MEKSNYQRKGISFLILPFLVLFFVFSFSEGIFSSESGVKKVKSLSSDGNSSIQISHDRKEIKSIKEGEAEKTLKKDVEIDLSLIKKSIDLKIKNEKAISRIKKVREINALKMLKDHPQKAMKKEIQRRKSIKADREYPQFGEILKMRKVTKVQKSIPLHPAENQWKPSGVVKQDLNFQVNGVKFDTIVVRDSAVFTFAFPDGETTAYLWQYIDMNKNGIIDTADYVLEDSMEIVDNDLDDEDPRVGFYQHTMDEETSEGLNRVVISLLFYLESGLYEDMVGLDIQPLSSKYSISGNITPGIPGIIVMAFPYEEAGKPEEPEDFYGVLTDSFGDYTISVPDDIPMVWVVITRDYLGVTEGLFPSPPFQMITVSGHETEVNFQYIQPTAEISGIVTDDQISKLPLSGISVYAYSDLGFAEDVTDENGEYSLGVVAGDWWVFLDSEDLIPSHLVPPGQYIVLADGDVAPADFLALYADATITGMVYYDDVEIGDIEVRAFSEAGFTYTYSETQSIGEYTLHVSSRVDEMGGYEVGLGEIPEASYVLDYYSGIESNSTGIDFHIKSTDGVIHGYVTDSSTGDSLSGIWVNAWNDSLSIGFGNETDNMGYYRIYVPNGEYNMAIEERGYYRATASASVSDDTVEINFALEAATFTGGGIEGYIRDAETNQPIPIAEVSAWSQEYADRDQTDESGFYRIDLPNGVYSVWVWARDYMPVYIDSILVQDQVETMDFYLKEIRFEGAVEGYVTTADGKGPIQGAEVQVYNELWWFNDFTDESGYYYIPVFNGRYDATASAEGYLPQTEMDIEVNNNVVEVNFNLIPFVVEGAIDGVVTDAETDDPIPGADVYAYSWYLPFGFWTTTDDSGYYKVEVPNDTFTVEVNAEGYLRAWEDSIVVNYDTVTIDFELTRFTVQGAIEGYVYDKRKGFPLWGAGVDVYNEFVWMTVFTDSTGYYRADLPNGTYYLTAWAEDYEGETVEDIVVENDVKRVDFFLRKVGVYGPVIISIRDVPHDQGRKVRIIWDSGHSSWETFTGFSIWRKVNEPWSRSGEQIEKNRVSFGDGLWDFIKKVPFHGFGLYSYVAPTLVDSSVYTAKDESYWTTFMVTAHTYDVSRWYDSPPDSGYSIDNLHPSPPTLVTADGAEDHILVTWKPIPDKDFDYYAVYRSTQPGFDPDLLDPYFVTIDSFFKDMNVQSDITYYYRISSFDFNGNESDYSEEVYAKLTGLRGELTGQIPESYGIEQNYPNPFNPETHILYQLPESGWVNIKIYNLFGQVVKTLVNEYQDAGYYKVKWDSNNNMGKPVSSGIYLYTIRVNDFNRTLKMILIR